MSTIFPNNFFIQMIMVQKHIDLMQKHTDMTPKYGRWMLQSPRNVTIHNFSP